MIRFAAIVVLVISLFTACDQGKVYQEVRDIPNQKWAFSEIEKFQVNMSDTLNPHLLLVEVRNSATYSYSNLWLFITQIDPSGNAKTDTVECPLAYPDGKWVGDGIGDVIDNLILFRKDYRFPESGEYTYKIQHGMRSDTLNDILSIGLRVQKGYQ
tara:strand:+ start:755 stop:1222 length:468 start_codon:yes stop_codon:yes gene_type:complete